MRNTVKNWLESGEVDVFLGYRLVDGHPLPHAFSRDRLDELETFVTGPVRYPLEKMAAEILAENPDLRVGVLVRECNERALTVLSVTRQLDLERTQTLKASCCPSTPSPSSFSLLGRSNIGGSAPGAEPPPSLTSKWWPTT